MKNITTLITTFGLLSFFAAICARADLIWYEGFNYANGFVETVSTNLWVTNSTGGGGGDGSPNDMYVNNHRLEVSATGGTDSRVNDCNRLLSVTNNSIYTNTVQVLFASFTVICTNLPNGQGTYFASFYSTFTNGGGYLGRIHALVNGTVLPNTWRLGVSYAGVFQNSEDAVDLALNTPYQVVAELDPVNNSDVTLWVNPISSSDPSIASRDFNSPITGVTNIISAFSFRQPSSFGNAFFQITNLVLATTFAEAATNVWTTNAVPPTIAYQPVGLTNYVASSVSVSAVANGQGLVNLTYQWQVSAAANNSNPVNVSGGEFSGINANILNINNAQTGDSGYYTLIATTPYGLSATSSVAKVLISAAPVPPSFVTEPVSQTVYSGLTVFLSTTVITPGTPSYTWYSNNVVVTAGQSDSGDTSSLEIDNVTTNSSATYKVAVTNSVVSNGIVSTNAVLTVLSPPVVTIAYLRSLVDPLNGYLPTNSPPTLAYQITGTVTTFTNLTSGNTSSYYLQDGTGGINIFATGGSTFRPAQGDVVTFIGVLSGYATGLELYADTADTSYPYTSYTDTGNTNALPAPIPIPFNFISAYGLNFVNTNLAGSLVKLTDVHFGASAGTTISTTANQVVAVTNSSGQSCNLEFFDQDLDTAGQTLPTYAYSVSGVVYDINTNFSIAVTRFADIVTNAPGGPVQLNLGYSGGILTFNWSDSSFSLQSSTNVTGPYITIPGASSGFITNTTSARARFFRLYHP
jgi:hypothetical protein